MMCYDSVIPHSPLWLRESFILGGGLVWGADLIAFWSIVVAVMGWTTRNEWIIPFTKNTYRFVKANAPGAKNNKMLLELIGQMEKNGGSTIRDRLDMIYERQSRLLDMAAVAEMRKTLIEDHVRAATFITNSKGDCVHASQAYLEIVGMTLDEAKGAGWKNGIHPDDLEEWVERWRSAFDDAREFVGNVRYRNVRTDEIVCVRVNFYAVKSEGKLVAYVGIVKKKGSSVCREGMNALG